VTLASNSGKGRFAPSPSGPWTSTLDVTIAVNTSTSPPFYYRDKLAGAAALTASATDKQSGTQTESVAPAAIATLKISPKTATVAPGGTRTFTAKGADAYGNAVATDGASWSV